VLWAERVLLSGVKGRKTVKVKHFIALVAAVLVPLAAYTIHSQFSPQRLESFVVHSVFSTPQAGSPYLRTVGLSHVHRGDGSYVTIWTRDIQGQQFSERDIYDYTTRTFTVVDDLTESTTSRYISDKDMSKRLQPAAAIAVCRPMDQSDSSDVTYKSGGKILGYDVTLSEQKYVMHTQNGDANAVVKSYAAPELGCFVLQKETTWTRINDGALLVDTKITPISVTFQSVDQFFHIPENYLERKPSEVIGRQSARYPTLFSLPENATDLDEIYQKEHQQLLRK
jgi:hypothetical protein